MIRIVLFACVVALAAISSSMKAQPVNDICASAIPLGSLGTNPLQRTPLNLSFLPGATASLASSAGACSNSDNDVWYSVNTAEEIIMLTTNRAYSIYASCADAAAGIELMNCRSSHSTPLLINAFTPGQTFFIRFHWQSFFNHTSVNLTTAAYTVLNDNCSGATLATTSMIVPDGYSTASGVIGCTNSTPQPDAWFRIIAPNTGGINLRNQSGSFQTLFQNATLYEGTSCGALTQIGCGSLAPPSGLNIGGLTPGETYYIQTVRNGTTTIPRNFTVLVTAVPGNADCNSPFPLPVRPAGVGCAVPNTGGRFYDWTATTNGLLITNPDSRRMEVTISDACGGNTILSASINSGLSFEAGGWNINDNLIVRITWRGPGNVVQFSGTFCTEELTFPPPPANDNCSTPLSLTVGAPPVPSEFGGATLSSIIPSNCFDTEVDIWYNFTVPASGIVEINSTQFFRKSLFASCSSVGIMACSVGDLITGLIPGDEILLRLSGVSTTSSPFSISIEEIPAPPINTICATALPAPVLAEGECAAGGNSISIDLTGAVAGNTGCGVNTKSVWYTWTATSNRLYFDKIQAQGIQLYQGPCNGSFPIINCQTFSGEIPVNIGTAYTIQVFTSTDILEFCLEERQVGPRPVATPNGCGNTISKVVDGSNGVPAVVDFVDNNGSIYCTIATSDNLGLVNANLYTIAAASGSRSIPNSNNAFDLGRNLSLNQAIPASNFNTTITFYATSTEVTNLIQNDPAISSVSDLTIAHVSGSATCSSSYDGSGSPASLSAAAYGSDWAFTFSASSFSEFFVVSSSAPLPVELFSFTATEIGASNKISWEVGHEDNVSHYGLIAVKDVQQSISSARLVKTVSATGSSSYSVIDLGVDNDTDTYYKLTTYDFDGTSSDSELIVVSRNKENLNGFVFQNLIHRGHPLKISTDIKDGPATLVVFSSTGRILQEINLSKGFSVVSLEPLPAGTYLVSLNTAKGVATKKLFVN